MKKDTRTARVERSANVAQLFRNLVADADNWDRPGPVRARHIPAPAARSGRTDQPALCGRLDFWADVVRTRGAYMSALNREGACRPCVRRFEESLRRDGIGGAK